MQTAGQGIQITQSEESGNYGFDMVVAGGGAGGSVRGGGGGAGGYSQMKQLCWRSGSTGGLQTAQQLFTTQAVAVQVTFTLGAYRYNNHLQGAEFSICSTAQSAGGGGGGNNAQEHRQGGNGGSGGGAGGQSCATGGSGNKLIIKNNKE